jgi:uncharacterized OsmC-like protein
MEVPMPDTIQTNNSTVDMKARQLPLRMAYTDSPSQAFITDHATTRCDRVEAFNPLYGEVEFGDPQSTRLPISLHKGVGGQSDLPVPGELFSAAIASCLDSTIRVVANMLGIKIKRLEVQVKCAVDLRGTLRMKPDVQVGFQSIDISAEIIPEGDVAEAHLDAILAAAEQSCVVLQTIRSAPQVSVSRA